MEGDEARMRGAAHLMVSTLAGSLAMVTSKDPLRASLANALKAQLGGTPGLSPEMLESVASVVAQVWGRGPSVCKVCVCVGGVHTCGCPPCGGESRLGGLVGRGVSGRGCGGSRPLVACTRVVCASGRGCGGSRPLGARTRVGAMLWR
eukprot:357340-Chlamydomonas_euryale.AAC.2